MRNELLSTNRARRGSVIVIVLWAIGIAAVIGASVQLFAMRQATFGQEVAHRMQARWAARAGVENAIAVMAYHTEDPLPDDALAIFRDLAQVSAANLGDASYDIRHQVDGRDFGGPMDEHAKLNVGRNNVPLYELFDDMTPDQAAGIQDWIDEDDEPTMFGAESDHYLGNYNYEPRNGPLRSVVELELVAGIWSDFVRNEDLNLNNRLDPNENDGALTPPDDDANGVLDAGWSAWLTTSSLDDGSTDSGLPRIHLRRAEPQDIMDRLGVDEIQAQRLIAFGKNPDNTLAQLLVTPLNQIDASGAVNTAQTDDDLEPLTDDQLKAALAELRMLAPHDRQPGRVNINTVGEEALRRILEARGLPDTLADEILYLRNSRPEGLTSLLDLTDMQEDLNSDLLLTLADLFTTRSDVFTISSIGRSEISGLEVEIDVVVDRSTVPVRILEYREP